MASQWTDLAQEPLAQLDLAIGLLPGLAAHCDAEQLSDLRRLARVLKAAKSRLAGRNSELMTHAALNQLAGETQQATASLQAAKDTAEQGGALDLTAANGAADRILEALRTAPAPAPTPRAIEALAVQLEDESRLVQTRLEAKADELTSSIEQTRLELADQTNAVRADVFSARQDFEQAVAASRQQVAEIQARADSIIATQETSFSTTLDEQREKLGALREATSAKLDEWMKEQQSHVSEQLAAIVTEADATQEKMMRLLEETQKLAGIIAVTGLVGGYKKHADKESSASLWWRLVTVACGLGAVGFLIWAAVHASSASASWLGLVAKSGVSLALGTLAYYTGRLAGRHHARAAHYRSRELALASLGPYTERLPEAKQQELLETLAPTFFTELREDAKAVDWSSPAANGILEQAFSQALQRFIAKA